MSVHEFCRLKVLITLEQVNTTEWSEKMRIWISKIVMVWCCNLLLYENESRDEHAIYFRQWLKRQTCHVNHFFDIWQWCNSSGIEALEFLCIYTCVQPATTDVFPVVANARTKSIQKQVKSIDVNKIGSKKHLVHKSVLFRVELIASSFLDLIFKQARLNAAVRGFLFYNL